MSIIWMKTKMIIKHYFLKRVWKGDFLVPLENPSLIIQWACSSGSWCFEMALAYPDCTVVGLDESEGIPCTPTIPNMSKRQAPLYEKDGGMAQFENDSADLIVIRDEFMYFAPDDKWHTLLAQFYRVLKPGGFLEIYGHDFQLHATDPYGKKLDEWTRHLGTSAGVSPDFPQNLEKHCCELGFVEKDYRSADLPLGEWPVAPIMKEMGYLAKIIIIKRFQILKRWILGLEENLTEEEYTETIKAGMEECERQQNRFRCFYLAARKPLR
ncbi:S-adenosyl-L-methionine-dependent methyltransferase [Absidia repens]|uniref:S-adenosyl-L-methionine-dependent methyltransferase n=1 Tax=Absidia repens TaxID=90262 RepID=A0A1X2IJ75_9FUNG|nr:S-adenosyl-L-methionine-dependent methyltransferase [Absidia repens]